MEIITRNSEPKSSLSSYPVLDRIFASRGVLEAEDLNLSLGALHDPLGIPDVDIAAERLLKALNNQEKIVIVGDYDADGATSVALCILCLRSFGFEEVDYLVPNRFEFGYGLSSKIVDLALSLNPKIILTVDNGTSSNDGVVHANALGLDVVITDHHLPGKKRPDAYALVNPVLSESTFPSRSLAGVGVAYYLMGVVRRLLRERGWFDTNRPEPNLADFLDLVALGTVADVVPLDKNNRVLVYNGIRRIRAGRCRPGIKAIAEIAGRDLSTISSQDLGFSIGPRLNAAGRLDDISMGIQCLLEEDAQKAQSIASSLNQLNKERQEIEGQMVAQAHALLSDQDLGAAQYGLVIYNQSFHQGVVGILAGRIREKTNRPVIAFADDVDINSGELKGSARSIEGLHIRDLLDQIAASNPGLLLKFGGHAMAAGLSIKKIHLDRFGLIFDKLVNATVNPDLLSKRILSDGQLSKDNLSLDLVAAIENAGPWGNDFPEPVFDGEFDLVSQRVVGQGHLKLVLSHDGNLIDAIAFRQDYLNEASDKVRVVYKPQINRYAGAETLQLLVEYIVSIP
ncbi:single-stranded-DNA-specific exonuclease RecJ [Gammaproteobacteria bacterium]|nr:single-stranded-DNA-specific exonuclease RecJ [Gammaproteobacteria bacterium]